MQNFNLYTTPSKQTVTWNIGEPVPVLDDFDLVVGSFRDGASASYAINFNDTSVPWLMLDSYSHSNGGLSVIEGVNTMSAVLQNLGSLAPGIYKATIFFDLENGFGNLDSASHTVTLTVSGTPATQITTDKSVYNLYFNRTTLQLSGDLQVGIVNNSNGDPLKFWTDSPLFAPAENFTNGFTLAKDSDAPWATTSFISNVLHVPAKIMRQTGEYVAGFLIKVIISEGGLFVAPNSLSFEVFKDLGEKYSSLEITNLDSINFNITGPSWLALSNTSGNANKSITVNTYTADLEPGTYQDEIKVMYDNKTIAVPVMLVLRNPIDITDEGVNFCLNFKPLVFYKINESARFMKVTMKVVFSVGEAVTDIEREFIVPYVASSAVFDLGYKVHRSFPRHKRPLFQAPGVTEIMKAATVNLTVEELDRDYNSLYSVSIGQLRFFPGKRPAAYPLLSNYLFRKKNAGSVLFFSKVENQTVICQRIDDAAEIKNAQFDDKTVTLMEFPRVYKPVHIQWENQNYAPEWFTVTGVWKISTDFSHSYAKNIFNSQNEKYDTSKVKMLRLNTGFILKQEAGLIEEMTESKVGFLKADNRIYRCINITPKMDDAASDASLFQYDLEFLIVEQ